MNIIPIRCTECGEILGDKYEGYCKMYNDIIEKDIYNNLFSTSPTRQKKMKDIFKKLRIKRICCKIHMMTCMHQHNNN